MKSLVIAEKPSVGRDIARVLKCTRSQNGSIEGNQYVVTWGLGHLVTLADPEGYDPKYKEWKLEHLPMMPDCFKLEVIKQTSKQYKMVKSLIHRKDIGAIIIATDAGREGELVARWILELAGSRKPVKRLWISSVTDKAIREGFAKLKDGKEYLPLYDAAVCRAEADWLVGINATRALTCKYNAQLSCGRVQTPTLAMIAAREDEIKSFRPQEYFGIVARPAREPLAFTWQDQKSGSYRSFDGSRVKELAGCLPAEGKITDISKKPKKVSPPGLYDLTELQREANQRFQLSAKETLNIMQRLYENHKVLTYPRTDSRFISGDIVPTLKDRLRACSVGPYRSLAGRLVKQNLNGPFAFVNDKKVSDHHAIIPTEQVVSLEHMTNEERKIYDLVVRRFIAVMYPPYEYEETILKLEAGGELFVAKGKIAKAMGWKEVYGEDIADGTDDDDLQEQPLKDYEKGTSIKGLSFTVTNGKTKPPAPFNEGTLLSAMENPVRYMESRDKAEVKTLGETGGLGTVATRADIIEKLFNSFLVEKRGKDIFVTSKGRQLLSLVPAELKKPELTARWEMKLSQIARGGLKRQAFMKEIRAYSQELIGEIKTGEGAFRHDNMTNKLCPECGKRLLLVKGKNSQMHVCQDRECGYRETISRTSNARCPQCHKKMELVGKGDNQKFICRCGHKEKLSSFQERRKKEGAGVSKKDVNAYLQKQRKEASEPINNPFADALSKFKFEE